MATNIFLFRSLVIPGRWLFIFQVQLWKRKGEKPSMCVCVSVCTCVQRYLMMMYLCALPAASSKRHGSLTLSLYTTDPLHSFLPITPLTESVSSLFLCSHSPSHVLPLLHFHLFWFLKSILHHSSNFKHFQDIYALLKFKNKYENHFDAYTLKFENNKKNTMPKDNIWGKQRNYTGQFFYGVTSFVGFYCCQYKLLCR